MICKRLNYKSVYIDVENNIINQIKCQHKIPMLR